VIGGVATILLALTGCTDHPALAPVSGRVTLDGQPLPRGMVQFVPVAEAAREAPTAVGEIGADGTYELKTGDRAGALVGKHRVRIEARAVPKNEADTLPASLIPDRFQSEATSELTVDVKANQRNTIDLPLSTP
jgi:hypothetical protein